MDSKKNTDMDESLLQVFLTRSEMIDSDINEANKILIKEGLDPELIRLQGIEFINNLQSQLAVANETSHLIKISDIIKSLIDIGIPKQLLENKIIPTALKSWDVLGYSSKTNALLSFAANIFSLRISENEISNKLEWATSPVSKAKFKIPGNANSSQIQAYSHYAHYLSRIVAKHYQPNEEIDVPLDIDEFRKCYLNKFKSFTLPGLLAYSWEIGICVLPLNDPGVFHGAAWNINGTRVVVVKQNTKSHARWIFDLLHEVYHALAHLDNPGGSIVETQEINPLNEIDSLDEREANSFSHQILFGSRSQEILTKCIHDTGGRMNRLKSVVQKTARTENISEDILANFIAFRLSIENHNWWGAAAALQVTDPDPFVIASDILRKNISTEKMSEMERSLFEMALSTNN